MQVDPINPTSKAPGTKHMKLKCDDLLSNLAFNFNLRRYNEGSSLTFDKLYLLRQLAGRC